MAHLGLERSLAVHFVDLRMLHSFCHVKFLRTIDNRDKVKLIFIDI